MNFAKKKYVRSKYRMSGVLAPFVNKLSEVSILPTEMKWRGDWVATTQYYRNDVVRSTLNGVEYILNGADVLYGGLDPADPTNTTTNWGSLGGITNSSVAPTLLNPLGGNYTVAGGDIAVAPANSRWLIVVQGTKTLVAAGLNTVADSDLITFTSSSGDAGRVFIYPDVDGAPSTTGQTNFSGSIVVQQGNAAGAITMTAQYFGAASAYTNTKVTFVRLV